MRELANLNFRDLGNLPAADGRTRPGVLYRSEGPANMTPVHLAAMQAIGFRTICDLRSARERDKQPHAWHGEGCNWLGLDVNADLRVFGHDGRAMLMRGPEPQIAIDTMVATYREIPRALHAHWTAIADAVNSSLPPVLINCTAGKDRTGVAVAVLLEIAGVPRDVIMADYLRSEIFAANLRGTSELRAGLMQSFGFIPPETQVEALIGVRAEYLEAAWDEIDKRYSGMTDYLEQAGLSHELRRSIADALVVREPVKTEQENDI